MSVRISIIIPCYNAAGFVRETLDSIPRAFKDRFEIIIVDDGSTDNSCELVEDWIASKNLRVRLIRVQNGGVARARNIGAALAGGEWLFFIDSDDIVDPTLRIYLDQAIQEGESEVVDWFSFRYRKFFTSSPESVRDGAEVCQRKVLDFFTFTPFRMPLCIGTVFVRRDAFFAEGGFPEGEPIGEDLALWIKLGIRSRLILYDHPTLHYRQKTGFQPIEREQRYSGIFPGIKLLLHRDRLSPKQRRFLLCSLFFNYLVLKNSQNPDRHVDSWFLAKQAYARVGFISAVFVLVFFIPNKLFLVARKFRNRKILRQTHNDPTLRGAA